MNKVHFTQEGFDKLKKEYDDLKQNKHEKAINRLHTARSMGDLSENSEYTAAKEDLAFLEGRLRELEELMKNGEIVSSNGSNGGIDIGDKVKVKFNDTEQEFQIVGEFEANPLEKKLSTTSPIGKALVNHHVGDQVEVQVPAGKITYTIISVTK